MWRGTMGDRHRGVLDEDREAVTCHQRNCVVVQPAHVGQIGRDRALTRAQASLSEDRLKGEDHILGGDRLPIVPGCIPVEMECVDQAVIATLPVIGQSRRGGAVKRIDRDESLEEEPDDYVSEAADRQIRIQRTNVIDITDDDEATLPNGRLERNLPADRLPVRLARDRGHRVTRRDRAGTRARRRGRLRGPRWVMQRRRSVGETEGSGPREQPPS